jgi:hypothetical protein
MEYSATRERGNGQVGEPGVGDLVSQLVNETGDLVKLEVARLRAEMIETSAKGIATGVSGAILGAVSFVALQALAVGAVLGFGVLLGSFVAGAFVAAAALMVFGVILFFAVRAPVRHLIAKKMGALPAPRELPEPSRSAGALPPAERTTQPTGVRH